MDRKNMPPVFERVHPVTDVQIKLKDGTSITALDLANRFFLSKAGLDMVDQPLRYSGRYEYDRDEMLIDNGHDLSPVGHQIELAHHLGTILEEEKEIGSIFGELTEEDLAILVFTCLVHDIGERTDQDVIQAGLTPVGDIPAGYKTIQNREDEAAVRRLSYAQFFSDVDSEIIERAESIIAHKEDSLLHDLFEAAHAVQTAETTMFAYHQLARETWYRHGDTLDPVNADHARISGLLGISRVAFETALPHLEKYSYLAHVKKIKEKGELLRNPPHRPLNSLYR